ncbi:uncharacterized protein LOC118181729 [Stegodyphus dumicola]|uniref:uncharacterized protein LOC118181729 n=1 Tax=Stegodyphus dumicola TaxID=202533 RepID=UPI0015AC7E5F|nr:uncharacterized protein LOC118181729 [Stegodyphus dumicola]
MPGFVPDHNLWKEISPKLERYRHKHREIMKDYQPEQEQFIRMPRKGDAKNLKTKGREQDCKPDKKGEKVEKFATQQGYQKPGYCRLCELESQNERQRCQDCCCAITYHCFRCCACGIESMSPRELFFELAPRIVKYEGSEEKTWKNPQRIYT